MVVLHYIISTSNPDILHQQNILDGAHHLGTIMQLIDDCIDVMADLENGIYTIATHEFTNVGNLDRLWYDICNKILSIPTTLTSFIIIYAVFAVYVPDRVAACFSADLLRMTNRYNMFDYHKGVDGAGLLVKYMLTELCSIEVLEELNAQHSILSQNE